MSDSVKTSPENSRTRPTVSVVMCIHNEEEYGPAAIQSILDQSFTDFEFIIVDDASTDSTPAMLQSFADRDPRIRILTNTENVSVPHSLNKGLRAATGSYIARMDGDDISMPHRLAAQVQYLDENPASVLVGGGVALIDDSGRRTATYAAGASAWEFAWTAFFRPPLIHSSAMFRQDLITLHREFYDHTYNRAEDFEFWHRLLRHGSGCELPGVLVQYRVHDSNVSTVYRTQQRNTANRASKVYACEQFPLIAEGDLNYVFDFLRSGTSPKPIELKRIVSTIEKMQSMFAKRHSLSTAQAKDIRRKTAKLLIRTALDRGLLKRPDGIALTLELIARYFPDYVSSGVALLRRRVGLSRAS